MFDHEFNLSCIILNLKVLRYVKVEYYFTHTVEISITQFIEYYNIVFTCTRKFSDIGRKP